MSAVLSRVAAFEPPQLDVANLWAILDRLDRAIIVVDDELRADFANELARGIAQRRDAIAVEQQTVTFLAPLMQRRVQGFIQRAVTRESQRCISLRTSLPRSSGARDYLLAVHLLPNTSMHLVSHRFLVEIHEPTRTRTISTDTLRDLFGLTRAEAIVVSGLFANCDVNELSRQLGVSGNTVRTHIRAAYAKCEVHSLPQLLQLVALSPY
ncbi:MAG TPA: LuxR C-terminal-related transcriptional regulator [Steroidobacteraceae bacterium]|nr:LuxR C-terminal-related transcriptional regulator [Steroidobacteraceae bacterium]